jgi:YXWGXW repeat-containing protein
MKASRWIYAAVLLVSGGLGGLAGCVVAPAPYYEGDYPLMAPPPAREEIVGAAPGVGFVWSGGYWDWAGRSYAWRPGHWEAPRSGYRWVPHRWVQEGQHWRHTGGTWENVR